MTEDFFMMFEPYYHLWKFVLSICCIPGILCKVNMKTFSVAVVSRAKKFNVHEIVIEKVKFGNIEIVVYVQINKNVFVVMKLL